MILSLSRSSKTCICRCLSWIPTPVPPRLRKRPLSRSAISLPGSTRPPRPSSTGRLMLGRPLGSKERKMRPPSTFLSCPVRREPPLSSHSCPALPGRGVVCLRFNHMDVDQRNKLIYLKLTRTPLSAAPSLRALTPSAPSLTLSSPSAPSTRLSWCTSCSSRTTSWPASCVSPKSQVPLPLIHLSHALTLSSTDNALERDTKYKVDPGDTANFKVLSR